MFKLIRYLRPYWWQVIILLLSIALQTWFTLRLPALMAEMVNYGIVTGDTSAIWSIGLRMLACAGLTAIGALSSSYFSSIVGTAFSRDLRADFYAKVLSFSLTDIDKFSTASLITRTTNDISRVQEAIIMMLSMMLRAPMMCIVAIVQALTTAPDMSWIIATAIALIIVLVVIVIASVMKKFKLFQILLDKITLLTRENLTGLRVIRAFNNEEAEKKKFEKTNDELTSVIIFTSKIMSLVSPLISFIFNGICLVCIWVGISLISKDFSYLGNMMAFMQYAIQVVMSFLVLTIFFMMLPRANVSAARVNEVLERKEKIKWEESTKGCPEVAPSVEFKNVDFAYHHAEAKVLEGISFRAEAGKTTAFIGSTGSGKSTLVSLIPRFYDVTSGEIRVNGLDIRTYNKEDLMRRIGFVPQKGMLFSGTVAENIRFGAPEITDEEVEHAAKLAQADNFIKKLEKGYKFHISEGGKNVSGGQKQRLCIARALAKKPEILIFDDSFSALDMKTDKNLREALKPEIKDSVVLIVAQRISTIKDADQIIVLNEGRIVGKGTHAHLMTHCKVYQEIVRSQLSEAEYEKEKKNASR